MASAPDFLSGDDDAIIAPSPPDYSFPSPGDRSDASEFSIRDDSSSDSDGVNDGYAAEGIDEDNDAGQEPNDNNARILSERTASLFSTYKDYIDDNDEEKNLTFGVDNDSGRIVRGASLTSPARGFVRSRFRASPPPPPVDPPATDQSSSLLRSDWNHGGGSVTQTFGQQRGDVLAEKYKRFVIGVVVAVAIITCVIERAGHEPSQVHGPRKKDNISPYDKRGMITNMHLVNEEEGTITSGELQQHLDIGNDHETHDAKSLPPMAIKIRDEDNAASTSAAAAMIAAVREEGHEDEGVQGLPSTQDEKPSNIDLFCGTCMWGTTPYDCDYRIKFLVGHYQMTADGAKRMTLADGDCLQPGADPATDLVSEKEEETGAADEAESESTFDGINNANLVENNEEDRVPNGGIESTATPAAAAAETNDEEPNGTVTKEGKEPEKDAVAGEDTTKGATSKAMEDVVDGRATTAAAVEPNRDGINLFCDDCHWLGGPYTCGYRVKYMVEHYAMTKEGATESLLGDGCSS
mmetsp:Transcript_28878/g.69597  ORF Transcript_28878/g.69597 Transcript_28878/m.69597 type:complete len:522 (-) Transcript_28878:69-1634(-)